jgi:hypothetical protein
MRDQYGNDVPTDLVVLPTHLGLQDTKVVMSANWYEANGILMASYKAIYGLSESDPLEPGVLPTDQILYVAHALKRYSKEDGFYHA